VNSIVTGYVPLLRLYQELREQMLATLTDDDLTYSVSLMNPPLGMLCRAIGETEECYIESFSTYQIDFSYQNPDPELELSVAALKSWYADLDARLADAVESIPEEDVETRHVDHGGGFTPSILGNLDVYKEALLIFYGKVDVYLRALGKPRSDRWQAWIA
jgi:hypothetical protein